MCCNARPKMSGGPGSTDTLDQWFATFLGLLTPPPPIRFNLLSYPPSKVLSIYLLFIKFLFILIIINENLGTSCEMLIFQFLETTASSGLPK